MNYWLTFNFQASNNGLELATHWVELGIPARTIYLALAIWAGRKAYKKLQERKAN